MLQRQIDWPVTESGWEQQRPRVAVVVVNYNTVDLLPRVIYAVRTRLCPTDLSRLLIVDNGSTDGSVELLDHAAKQGLIDRLANERNRQHGPALTQAVDWLAGNAANETDLIWVLDSDCLVLREDVLDRLYKTCQAQRPACVGQADEGTGYLALNSLVIDPAQVWRAPLPAFQDEGDPARLLLDAANRMQLPLAQFDFRREGFVLHRGRSTLRQLVHRAEVDNPLYEWATHHNEPHWGLHPEGPELWAAFESEFTSAVPGPDAETLAAGIAGRGRHQR